eukprot:1071557-Rhodomonas_salina.4
MERRFEMECPRRNRTVHDMAQGVQEWMQLGQGQARRLRSEEGKRSACLERVEARGRLVEEDSLRHIGNAVTRSIGILLRKGVRSCRESLLKRFHLLIWELFVPGGR